MSLTQRTTLERRRRRCVIIKQILGKRLVFAGVLLPEIPLTL